MSTARRDALEAEVAARLPALPALARQLLDAAADAEAAVALVAARFRDIGARAWAALDATDEALGDGLLNDLATAAMALQFQDAMSQRVRHVVAALGELHDALRAGLDGRPPAGDPAGWADRLRDSFTMARERDLLAEGTIELF